jgi:T-complex protein 1 subunit theta
MAMRNMKRGVPNLFKSGVQHNTGLEAAVVRNLEACKALADLTKTSFGPNGMNKLVINYLEKIFVTSDCATLINEMEVAHPAAKMMAMAAAMQEQEIGDGSNFIIIFAGQLLTEAIELVKMGLHPSEIIQGFDLAGRKALELLDEQVCFRVTKTDIFDKAILTKAVRAAVASKQFGHEDLLSPLVAEACLAVMPKNPYNFGVDNVRVAKIPGGSLEQSEVIRGVVCLRGCLGVQNVKEAKVGVFTCNLGLQDTETKGTVLIKNAEDLLNFNESEEKEIERQIKAVADSGINVMITSGSIDDMAKHFCERFHMMVIKISSKFELRRLCRATGARPQIALGVVSKEDQGFCSHVYVKEVGLSKITIFEQGDNEENMVATVVLRASTSNVLNDVEKAIDDGVNVVKAMGKNMGEDGAGFVAGAGAVEIELARQLHSIGAKSSGLDQYSIKKFAEAFEVFPRSLADNCGQNSMDVVSKLYTAHEKGDNFAGLDVETGNPINASDAGIYDILAGKRQALKLAVDAAVTVLRVDQIIMAKPAGGPKMPQGNPQYDA